MMTSSDGTIGHDEGERRLIVPFAPLARRYNHFQPGFPGTAGYSGQSGGRLMETALAGLGLSAFAALALGVAHFSRQAGYRLGPSCPWHLAAPSRSSP